MKLLNQGKTEIYFKKGIKTYRNTKKLLVLTNELSKEIAEIRKFTEVDKN